MEDHDSVQKLSPQLGAHTTYLISTSLLIKIDQIYSENYAALGYLLSQRKETSQDATKDLQKVFSSCALNLKGKDCSQPTTY